MIPLWLKLAYTLVAAVILAVYFVRYGLRNFLWFSDIALIVTGVALWLESALLASMMAVGVLLPEIVWNAGFFGGLLTGKPIRGLAGYMFDRGKPRYLRALSLFHVVLPPVLVWLVWRLGYDADAWVAQTALAWVVLPLTYALTDPADNINWVFGPLGKPQDRLPPLVYLGLLMLALALLVYLPTHLLLRGLFG
jgi:hypothetical protein